MDRGGSELMRIKVALFFVLFVSASVWADEWVQFYLNDSGVSVDNPLEAQVSKTGSLSKAARVSGLEKIDNLPFINLQSKDVNDVIVNEKRITYPRAVWAPMDKNGKHGGIFLQHDGAFIFEKIGRRSFPRYWIFSEFACW